MSKLQATIVGGALAVLAGIAVHAPLVAIGIPLLSLFLALTACVYMGALLAQDQRIGVALSEISVGVIVFLCAILGSVGSGLWLAGGYAVHGLWDWAHEATEAVADPSRPSLPVRWTVVKRSASYLSRMEATMVKNPDEHFFDRADEHIDLANAHLSDAGAGKVSASMMYATARFNVWLSASSFTAPAELKKEKKKAIEYFVTEYRRMLEDNMDDYIDNFDSYMQAAADRDSESGGTSSRRR